MLRCQHGIIMVGSLGKWPVITFENPATQLLLLLHAERRAFEGLQALCKILFHKNSL